MLEEDVPGSSAQAIDCWSHCGEGAIPELPSRATAEARIARLDDESDISAEAHSSADPAGSDSISRRERREGFAPARLLMRERGTTAKPCVVRPHDAAKLHHPRAATNKARNGDRCFLRCGGAVALKPLCRGHTTGMLMLGSKSRRGETRSATSRGRLSYVLCPTGTFRSVAKRMNTCRMTSRPRVQLMYLTEPNQSTST
jgi:hypothetical protein